MSDGPQLDLQRDIGWFFIDRDEASIPEERRQEILSDLQALVDANPDQLVFESLEEFTDAFQTPHHRQQDNIFGSHLPERKAFALYRAAAFFDRVHHVTQDENLDVIYQFDDFDCNWLGGACSAVGRQLYLNYQSSPQDYFEDLFFNSGVQDSGSFIPSGPQVSVHEQGIHIPEPEPDVSKQSISLLMGGWFSTPEPQSNRSTDNTKSQLTTLNTVQHSQDSIPTEPEHPPVLELTEEALTRSVAPEPFSELPTTVDQLVDSTTLDAIQSHFDGQLSEDQIGKLILGIATKAPDARRTPHEYATMIKTMKGLLYRDMLAVIDAFDDESRNGSILHKNARDWATTYRTEGDYAKHSLFLDELFEARPEDFENTNPQEILIMATIETRGISSANSDGLLQLSGMGWMSFSQQREAGMPAPKSTSVSVFSKFFYMNDGPEYTYNGENLPARKSNTYSNLFSGTYFLEQGCYTVELPGNRYLHTDSFMVALIGYNDGSATQSDYILNPQSTTLASTNVKHMAKALIVQEVFNRMDNA